MSLITLQTLDLALEFSPIKFNLPINLRKCILHFSEGQDRGISTFQYVYGNQCKLLSYLKITCGSLYEGEFIYSPSDIPSLKTFIFDALDAQGRCMRNDNGDWYSGLEIIHFHSKLNHWFLNGHSDECPFNQEIIPKCIGFGLIDDSKTLKMVWSKK